MTAVPPELVRLSVLFAVLLTATLPKLREDDVTPNTPGVVPLPEREMSNVEFDASLSTEIFPLAGPPDCGLKLTLKLALCPAPSVSGKVRPLTTKAAFVELACVTLTVDPPELVRVSCRLFVSPTCTLPKLKLAGLATSEPGVVPDPERGTLSVEFEASLIMERFPLAGPPACGLNFTLKLVLCPAPIVAGRVSPVTVNPLGTFA